MHSPYYSFFIQAYSFVLENDNSFPFLVHDVFWQKESKMKYGQYFKVRANHGGEFLTDWGQSIDKFDQM